jgi:prolipoprotein diacylglyceryltransferase
MIAALLAQGYRPFLTPLPVWDYWYALIVPLCFAVSVVYKAMRCKSMRDVPRQAALITLYILLAMVAAAVLLVVIVKIA